jgi:hypothetical protein
MSATDGQDWAVLIADVVGSRSRPDLRWVLGAKLRRASRMHRDLLKLHYAVTAGDEFQAVALRPAVMPELIFDLRRSLQPLALRIGVGIGPLQGPLVPPVNKLSGEAFVFARQAIEDVKAGASHKYPVLTAVQSRNASFDRIANLVYGLHDTLLQEISARQWRTIDVYLVHRRHAPLSARALGIATSTLSRNLRRGRFWQISETVEKMKAIMESCF